MPAAHAFARRVTRTGRLIAPCLLLLTQVLFARPALAQEQQDAALFRSELEMIQLANRERRQAGLPPLAWNAELTVAARGFARDTVENRSAPYCGHVDSGGRSATQRMRDAGYSRVDMTAENALCGYLPAAAALKGWMKSPPHRANILNPDVREVGAGYYRSAAGRGYVVLDLALDRGYAPLIVDDEAPTTSDPQVRLYLYDQDAGDNWQGVGPTVAMLVANTPDFAGAAWEPYTAERDWTLAGGEGWRTVYVKTMDRLGRTTIVHDSIYLGSAIPDAELALEYATQVDSGVVIQSVDGGGYSHIQFSANWLADDSSPDSRLLEGAGERVDDAAAAGGSAWRLAPGSGPAVAMDWATSPLGKEPGVAYFRLKIADNRGTEPAAKLVVGDGSGDVAERRLNAGEFAAAGEYQEFAVPFAPSAAGRGLIVLTVTRTGSAELSWDTTAIYTRAQPIGDPTYFQAPGGYYRSSGVQARLVTPDGAGIGGAAFSAPIEVDTLGKRDLALPGKLYIPVVLRR